METTSPSHVWSIVRGLILLLMFLAGAGMVGFWLLKRSEDPARLIFKWIITLPLLAALVFVVAPLVAKGGYGGAFGGIPMAAVCGLALAIIWRDNLSSVVANAFGNLYDGGSAPPEPQPFYSLALAKRKRGQYREAITEIWKQLEKFPNDTEGQFMMAEIQAENLNDLTAADMTIQRICNRHGQVPGSIAMALNALADWRLKYGQDRDGAQEALGKIIERLPDSEFSAMAAQRIAHLSNTEHLLGAYERRKIEVVAGVEDIGLLPGSQQPKAPEVDLEKQAVDYVKHLEAHPLDTEARENLAVLYANHFQRLDLAVDQLEQLITHPAQPAARVVHWVNLLADLQMQHGAKYETVRATLQRILEMFPDTGFAGPAVSRIAHLKLEFRGKEKSQTVKLGSYEQDIGLKRKT